jgi:hypothetical protein
MNAPFKPDTSTATPQPTEHEQRANEAAARIAAREVYAHWVRTGSEQHLATYEAWKRGERSWPWPDPTLEEAAAADDAMRALIAPLLSDEELRAASRGQRKFERDFGCEPARILK